LAVGNDGFDPFVVWKAVKECIYSAVKHSSETVKCICVSSFGETCAYLNSKVEAVTESMLYTDTRGREQVETLIDILGEDKITKTCGCKPHIMYFLPKLM